MSESKTFETPEPIAVTLAMNVADVRISAGERTDIVVTVIANDASKKADVAAGPCHVQIRANLRADYCRNCNTTTSCECGPKSTSRRDFGASVESIKRQLPARPVAGGYEGLEVSDSGICSRKT